MSVLTSREKAEAFGAGKTNPFDILNKVKVSLN